MTTSAREARSFGALLRRQRAANGLSQEALAERAGLSVQAVSALERGIRRHPHAATVRLLADALEATPAERAALDAAARSHRASTGLSPLPSLPVPLTPLVGRESDEEALARLLQQERVRALTLTGPGGVGKTHLGVHVATEHEADFADGVAFINLAATREPGLVATTIAQGLGVTETAGLPLLQTLIGVLRERHTLLLLDNFEHVLPAASILGNLLAACPHLQLLVMSRAALRIRGEYEYPVAPLALPAARPDGGIETTAIARCAAVTLFVTRAQARKADFALTAENAAVVAAICRRLDGLPLALELAAGWVKVLSPHALLARLETRLGLLVGGAHDLPERQRTMRGTVAWSYGLLSPDEHRLFRGLAAFPGGCTLDTLEAMCAAMGTQIDTLLSHLASLVDMSLVQQIEQEDGEIRFTMLETIREFGLEQLASAHEDAMLRRAQALFYAGRVEDVERYLAGPEQGRWFRWLGDEYDNLRAILQWCVQSGEAGPGLRVVGTLWRYWWVRSALSEGRSWLERLLALPLLAKSLDDARARAKATHGAGMLALRQGDRAGARLQAEDSLALATRLGDDEGVVAALNLLALVTEDEGQRAEAIALFEDSLGRARDIGQQWYVANALTHLGLIAHRERRLEQALALLSDGLALYQGMGEAWSTTHGLVRLGAVIYEQGDIPRASRLFQQSLALFRGMGDKVGMAYCLERLADVAEAHGNSERADLFDSAAAALRADVGAPMTARAEQNPTTAAPHGAARSERDNGAAGAGTKGLPVPLADVIALAVDSSGDDETPPASG